MDAETLQRALTPVLAEEIEGFESLKSCERLTGGASQETWRLGVATSQDDIRLCLRRGGRSLGGDIADAPLGPATEARLMQAAAAAGIPVPKILHVFEPGSDIGDAVIMEWLEGETLGGRIVHGQGFADARTGLARQCGEILGRLHGIDPQDTGLNHVLHAATPEQLVRASWNQYKWLATPQPMLDYSARWLLDNLPPAMEPTLVHGDFRNGNLMLSPEAGVVGVLDWELAMIGDPIRDLGWLCTNSWRFGRPDLPVGGFGDYGELLAGYEQVTGRVVDPEHLRFWIVFGSFWWSVCCLRMAQSYRSGENTSLERPAIGRRASEGQMDCVCLLGLGSTQLPLLSPQPGSSLPRLDELLGSISNFLGGAAQSQLTGSDRYLAKVAGNSLAIARRQLQCGPALDQHEQARLTELLEEGGDLESLRWKLVGRLRDDRLQLDNGALREHLHLSCAGQLAIDQPHYRPALSLSVESMWENWLASTDPSPDTRRRGFEAWHFCDNEADAGELAQLALAGKKRATASAAWHYKQEQEALPEVGALSIVTDWAGNAVCIIRTTRVDILPFAEVSEDFAATEGEGDGSLASWREAHWQYFERELAAYGLEPTEDMPIVCEVFERVYP